MVNDAICWPLLRVSHDSEPQVSLCDYLLYFLRPLDRQDAQPEGAASSGRVASDIEQLLFRGTFDVPLPHLALMLAGSLLGASGGASSAPPSTVVQVAASASIWKFSRTQGPKDGESFAAITKTADTTQSDPDFAGLIVRCAPKGKIDVLVALIRPFPPRSHPQVTIAASNGGTLTVEASMAAAGAAVLLPDEVSAFASGKWQTTPSLSVAVKESGSDIRGVVALTGLREAYNSLVANCGQ